MPKKCFNKSMNITISQKYSKIYKSIQKYVMTAKEGEDYNKIISYT